jgi:aminopeptidase N
MPRLTAVVSILAVLIAAGSAEAQRRPVQPVVEDRPRMDVESYAVEITLQPAEHLLKGVAEVKVRQLERSSFLTFDLDSRLRVGAVLLDGVEARFRQYDLDGTVEVSTSGGQISDMSTFHFEYEGFLDPVPAGNRRSGSASNVSASISENGAYLLYEAKWFPTNQLYKDKAPATFTVKAPADWIVVSDLPSVSGGRFSSMTPSYWGLVAAGKYTSSTVKTDRGEVSIHTLNAKSEDAKPLVESAAKTLDFYASTFGPAIQPQFHIIEAADANWPSRWGVGALLLSTGQFRPDFDQPALAIALAHQWFPLKFAVEDPARDAWLGDGLATFASLLYAEKSLSPEASQEQIDKALVKALANEDQISVVEAGKLERESSEFRALVQYKGAYIFRMLRWVIGEEKFNQFLTRYVQQFQNAPASTDAVKKLASDVHGDELGYFFDQWLVDTGVPEMTAEYNVFRVKDGYRIEGQIRQDLDLFRMPVELEVETDSDPEYKRIDVARETSEFNVSTARKPKAVHIDPRKQILRLSPDIRVAVHINRGEELMNDGRFNDAQDQFQDAIDLNPGSSLASFRLGEALLEIGNTTQAATNFRNALTGDLKPRWVEVWSYINLGKVYDSRGDHERAIPEYQKAISTGDDSYGAQAEAQKYIKEPFRPGGATR